MSTTFDATFDSIRQDPDFYFCPQNGTHSETRLLQKYLSLYLKGSKYWRSCEERFSNGDNEIFAEASEDLGSIIRDNDFESLSDCVGRQGIYNMVDMFI
jgi:hypothetical protein